MEPPKHKHKKVPRAPADDPVPVLHSPPRKVSAGAADWVYSNGADGHTNRCIVVRVVLILTFTGATTWKSFFALVASSSEQLGFCMCGAAGPQIDPTSPPSADCRKTLQICASQVTVQDQQAWKIPPCVSNWKNARGYTIPLDKRLAADGRWARNKNKTPALYASRLA